MRDLRFDRADGRIVQMERIERNGRVLLTLRVCESDGGSRAAVNEWAPADVAKARAMYLARAAEPVRVDDQLARDVLYAAARWGRPAAFESALRGGEVTRVAALLRSAAGQKAFAAEVCDPASLVRRVRIVGQTAVQALPVELAVELDTWLDEATGVL